MKLFPEKILPDEKEVPPSNRMWRIVAGLIRHKTGFGSILGVQTKDTKFSSRLCAIKAAAVDGDYMLNPILPDSNIYEIYETVDTRDLWINNEWQFYFISGSPASSVRIFIEEKIEVKPEEKPKELNVLEQIKKLIEGVI